MQEPTSTQFEDAEQPTKTNIEPSLNSQNLSKFNSNFYARARTAIYMMTIFILTLAAGQIYCMFMVFLLNFAIFRQINSIKRNQQKQMNIPMTKYINWYLFGVVNYYNLGVVLTSKIPIVGIWYPIIFKLLTFHNFICFSLVVIGLLMFVFSLKPGYLSYQFRLFGWIVITTLLVCFQSWFMVQNLFQGMIWFIIPTLLIICNDVFAYLVGYFFGKHKLIDLSPKKTWQGYLGGAIVTFIASFILTACIQRIPGITCPMTIPSIIPFQYPKCDPLLLQSTDLNLPFTVTSLQLHILVLSLFASIIGPFGGFFASGLKRAIKIKDFANLIPGHGGVSDRMDCQIIMGSFTYFYVHTFVFSIASASLTAFWLDFLTPYEKLALYQQLRSTLNMTGLV